MPLSFSLSDYINIFGYNVIYIVSSLILITILFFLSKRYLTMRRLFIVLSLTTAVIYLYWRVTSTIPTNNILSIIFGVILVTCEIVGTLQGAVFKILFWKEYKPEFKPLSVFKQLPTIDIFIATYNEPIKILEKTVIGCKRISYPKEKVNIYLCDDGNRKEALELCKKYNIKHMTRPSNEHAKAGNLNHALTLTSGEIVMVLDADMIPRSNFLERTVGYFINPKVGFVQTPQVFYNPDPFQHNLSIGSSIPNEQDFFMRIVEQGRANYNAVLHVGTNALFRRTALESIGGIPTGSITEDMATGMLLQAKGHQSVFVNESLALGLSAEDLSNFMIQRDRWGRGNIQVAKKWNPFKIKGLSLIQRIIYFDGVLYWFNCIQKIVFIFAPIMFVVFNINIFNTDLDSLLTFFLPYYVSSYLCFRSFSKGGNMFFTHIYDTATAPRLIISVIMELICSKSFKFRVTPKGENSDKTVFLWKIALPQIIMFALNLAAVVLGLMHLNILVAINLVWILYNAFLLLMAIFVSFEKPRYRNFERFLIVKDVLVEIYKEGLGKLIDISDTGGKMLFHSNDYVSNIKVGDIIEMDIEFLGKLKCSIIRINKHKKSISELCVKFIDITNEDYENIMDFIFNKGCTTISPNYNMKSNISIPRIFLLNFIKFIKIIFTKKKQINNIEDLKEFNKQKHKVEIEDILIEKTRLDN